MLQHVFETGSSLTAPGVEDGPVLECSLRGSPNDRLLRIRARRRYAASRDEVFAAWTSRLAWDSWMRLRARSRSSVAPYRGGAFRLELAEGPTISIVTGTFLELRAPESLTLGWQHHGAEHGSIVDVSLRTRFERTELALTHSQISSRREAAWLMRLWTLALRRLDGYLSAPTVTHASEPRVQRAS